MAEDSMDSPEPKTDPSLIVEFLSRYRKEYDFYEQACRIAAQLLDTNLQSAGIRAIVTSRAKNPRRLEAKIQRRAEIKKFDTVEHIYNDIVDLAGVRVALYFPAEREATGRIISSLFLMAEPIKEFPDSAKPQPASYKKRFSGYWATHYRAWIKEEILSESQKHYVEAKVEIQVASVLMHAWSEVEHDLVYKPLQGTLSAEEYSILDELNGLILAGEIALERLQGAGEARVSKNHYYTNHFDLASSLLELVRKQTEVPNLHDALIGRVDLLFKLLNQLEQNTPEHVSRYVKLLHSDFETRPIAEQIIDQVLAEDPSRFSLFNMIRDQENPIEHSVDGTNEKIEPINNFLTDFARFEQLLRKYLNISPDDSKTVHLMTAKGGIIEVPPTFTDSVSRIRRFRSEMVHRRYVPSLKKVESYHKELTALIEQLEKIEG